MKSLNVKIPADIAERMSDDANLNPSFLNNFIIEHFDLLSKELNTPLSDLSYNYTFKTENELHRKLKIRSIEIGLPMNELIGRLLVRYYARND